MTKQDHNHSFSKTPRGIGGLIKIEVVLANLVKSLNLSNSLKINQLQQIWPDIIDDKFKDCTQLMALDPSGNVIVVVENPTIAYELNLCKSQLISDLRKLAPDTKINNIKFDWKYYHQLKSSNK